MARQHDTVGLDARHVLKNDLRPKMAKAVLPEVKKIDPEYWKAQIGAVIRRLRGEMSQKEFADLINRDVAQVSRWEKGEDRPQFDAIFAVEDLQAPLVLELAKLSKTIGVETTLTIRRSA